MVRVLKSMALAGAGLFAAAGLAAAYPTVARPGTVNYVEGNVSLDGHAVTTKSLGSMEVSPGQVLETGTNGKAELLLTPGVYLRLGENGAVRMVSPSLTDTQVEVLSGEANLEVDMLAKENHLNVLDHGSDIHIQKKGIYNINADQPMVAVYDGKAQVQVGDQTTEVKKGKELPLIPAAKLKPQKFDRNQEDPLYAWSKLRSEYEAQANAASAQMVVMDDPGWWAGTGWYWNPYFDTFAFVPGAGYLYNPWGFGFYSPAFWAYNTPYLGGYYGGGYYGGYGGFRGWNGGHRIVRGGTRGAVGAAPAMGGSGLRFGGVRGGMAGRTFSAPAMRAPAMGGGGMRFGGFGGGGMRMGGGMHMGGGGRR